jgi:hypothetical protein
VLRAGEPSAVNCCPWTGYPPPRQKERKVFERDTLGLDFDRYSVALVLVLTLFLRYVCQVNEDLKTIEIGFQ